MIKFEWDDEKALSNLEKHGVSFEQAKSVFYDDFAKLFFDIEHAEDEDRFILLGMSSLGKLLIVCHCERAENTIRIISARPATRNESKHYKG